jgi:nucleoside-diphosphate-sugar epimerase
MSQSTDGPKRFVFLGASGRIGRLLRAVGFGNAEADLRIDWQFRTQKPLIDNALIWPDLTKLEPLLERAKSADGLDGLFVFLGASRTSNKTDTGQMTINVSLVDQALQAAAAAKIPRVLIASSSAVYGAGRGVPFSENSVLDPANAYGAAKRDMETLCRARAADYGIEICLLRIGNVAGADALLGPTEGWRSGDAPRRLDVYPDGDGPRRSYIGPESLADVLRCLALQSLPLPQVVNVAAPAAVSMKALLDAAQIDWDPRFVPASALQDIVLDCARLTTLSDIAVLDGAADSLVAQWRSALEAL